MNVTVENLAPCRKLVRVEVDAAAVDSMFDEITKRFQREVRLPGFRPGKAPREIVVRTYSKQIDDEVKRKMISNSYKKAVTDQKLHVVNTLDLEEIQFGRGQNLQFAATVETAPEFPLPEYKGLPVKRHRAEVIDEDVERALGVLREQRATYLDVNRAVQMDDFVVANYSATAEGKPLTDFAPTARGLTQQNNFWFQVKPGSFIPGFTEQLIGAQAGERRTVNVTFPQDFVSPQLTGKEGAYEVEVVQVKERVFPELNDEFAKSFGAEDLSKLREGVRRDLENELRSKLQRDTRNQLVKGLLDRVNFDLPESMVLQETRNVINDIVRETHERGVPTEAIDKQKEEIYNHATTSAKDRIKVSFLLGRIAEKEGIHAETQEISQRVLYLAHRNQIKPEKFVKQLQERGGVEEIRDQILSAKVLEFLERHAQIEELPPGAPAP